MLRVIRLDGRAGTVFEGGEEILCWLEDGRGAFWGVGKVRTGPGWELTGSASIILGGWSGGLTVSLIALGSAKVSRGFLLSGQSMPG